jgi:hypothetical protein
LALREGFVFIERRIDSHGVKYSKAVNGANVIWATLTNFRRKMAIFLKINVVIHFKHNLVVLFVKHANILVVDLAKLKKYRK